MWQLRFAVSAALACCALLMASFGSAYADEKESFDCRLLATQERPGSSIAWLRYSLKASHCYIFQAHAVRISREGVQSMALSHDIRDGIVYEVANYLDGPPAVHKRHGRLGAASRQAMQSFPKPILSRVEKHYHIALVGEERIADRVSVRLDIEPLDNLRYGHRLWLDRQTGLPLKRVLIDGNGQVLETFQMTRLESPELYQDAITFASPRETSSGPWQTGWLPPGYLRLPSYSALGVEKSPMGHYLYSDGLSSFSLFIEPLEETGDTLLPGLHRLGVSHAVVRHLRLGEQIMQIVVMGEVPPRVLGRVAARLGYDPAMSQASRAATEATAEKP